MESCYLFLYRYCCPPLTVVVNLRRRCHNPAVPRRIFTSRLTPGLNRLDLRQAHHARDVLRLSPGDAVELFDPLGRVGLGKIVSADAEVVIDVGSIEEAAESLFSWTVASAVPKGPRADWLVEKLSELGTAELIPLATARSVVLPEGAGKAGRWARLAEESARQSRRAGVMRIASLTPLPAAIAAHQSGWFFSTAPGALPAEEAVGRALHERPANLALFVGPEGGWTDAEVASFTASGLTPVSLGATILRIETAAVAAASLVATMVAPALSLPVPPKS